MPIRIRCGNKSLEGQVIERIVCIMSSTSDPKASYTDRKQELRTLCGSIQLVLAHRE